MSVADSQERLIELRDDELREVLDLVRGADSVELKLTIPDADQSSAVDALGMDPLDAQIRQVYFFDTPDLALNKAGVVIRARRIQGRKHDSVVKLRPVVPGDLPQDLRELSAFNVELDAMPGGYVCSATLKEELGPTKVRAAVSGELPLRKLFSKRQREFLAAHAPEGIDLDGLSVLGPVFVLKLKFSPDGYERRMVAEVWLYPDNTRILELSTKCAPSEMFQVALEARAFLSGLGVNLSGEQQTKTKTALEYFSGASPTASRRATSRPRPSSESSASASPPTTLKSRSSCTSTWLPSSSVTSTS